MPLVGATTWTLNALTRVKLGHKDTYVMQYVAQTIKQHVQDLVSWLYFGSKAS